LPGGTRPCGAIGAAAGSTIFGIDCTVLADGNVFVFEADTAMLVHRFTTDPAKAAAVDCIRTALAGLLDRRAG